MDIKNNFIDKITINQLYGGKKVAMQIYGEHSLNSDGSVIPFEEQMAIVSHFLHNQGSKYAKTFEDKAKGLIKDIYNIQQKTTNTNQISNVSSQYSLFSDLFSVPFLPIDNPKFTFIDLFAGIGGFRIAMQNLGGKCVFSSEWDKQAQKTYLLNYGEVPFGDITKESTKSFIPGDEKLNRYNDIFFPILEIFKDNSINRNSYKVQHDKKSIFITGESLNIEIPQEKFNQEASKLLKIIKTMNSNTDFSYLEDFLTTIGSNNIKAKSSDKADIRIVIHNSKTGLISELGYSIKSKLGAASTLINSNKDGTNFIYKIQGISSEQIKKFNSFNKFKKKFDYLKSINATITYHKTANDILHNNLTLLDLGIEKIIAESLLIYYSGNGRSLAEITDIISQNDPLQLLNNTKQPMYSFKVKQFLLAFALGLNSSTPWNGTFDANGGYIIVKEDGDIVCYHFFDRNNLENYIFFNTRFETPSTSRHNFGNIYLENNEYFLKLNLQVRFK